jgi:DNA-binding LacI/PurR family transcriptional regulator
VRFADHAGGAWATRHLIGAGRKRIAFLRGKENAPDSLAREDAYLGVLRELGLPFAPELVGEGNFDREEAAAAVEQWLSDGIEFDGLIAADDESALGGIDALHRFGLRIPEDVAVIGFNDIPAARLSRPPLTTLHAPLEAAGHEAVRKLLMLIRGSPVDLISELPLEPVVRESGGVSPSA